MSLEIRYDGMKERFILKAEDLDPVTAENLDEVSAAVAHYFRPRSLVRIHEEYAASGQCPVCRAMKEE